MNEVLLAMMRAVALRLLPSSKVWCCVGCTLTLLGRCRFQRAARMARCRQAASPGLQAQAQAPPAAQHPMLPTQPRSACASGLPRPPQPLRACRSACSPRSAAATRHPVQPPPPPCLRLRGLLRPAAAPPAALRRRWRGWVLVSPASVAQATRQWLLQSGFRPPARCQPPQAALPVALQSLRLPREARGRCLRRPCPLCPPHSLASRCRAAFPGRQLPPRQPSMQPSLPPLQRQRLLHRRRQGRVAPAAPRGGRTRCLRSHRSSRPCSNSPRSSDPCSVRSGQWCTWTASLG